jgi:hypothetical protein
MRERALDDKESPPSVGRGLAKGLRAVLLVIAYLAFPWFTYVHGTRAERRRQKLVALGAGFVLAVVGAVAKDLQTAGIVLAGTGLVMAMMFAVDFRLSKVR